MKKWSCYTNYWVVTKVQEHSRGLLINFSSLWFKLIYLGTLWLVVKHFEHFFVLIVLHKAIIYVLHYLVHWSVSLKVDQWSLNAYLLHLVKISASFRSCLSSLKVTMLWPFSVCSGGGRNASLKTAEGGVGVSCWLSTPSGGKQPRDVAQKTMQMGLATVNPSGVVVAL